MKTAHLALGCSILSLILFADLASASPPAKPPKAAAAAGDTQLTSTVQAIVKRSLLTPLLKRDRERDEYSRAPMAPTERRVRVLDSALMKDADGNEFVRIAIDARYEDYDGDKKNDVWVTDKIAGCVYPETASIFVKRGKDEYRGAAILLGKKSDKPSDAVCTAVEQPVVVTMAPVVPLTAPVSQAAPVLSR